MEKLHLCVKDSRYLFSASLSIFACLAILSFDLEQQAGAISLIFATLCAAGIIAFGILLQRSLHERLYKSKLPLKDAILIDLIRLGITALVLIVASVAFGLSAVVLQFTIFHLIGFSASVATLEVLAVLIALFTLPVIAIVFFAPIASSQEADTPSKDANRLERLISKLACLARVEIDSIKEQISMLYAPILGISVAVLILGLILQSIAALIAVRIVALFVSFIAQALLGFAWICALYDLIVDAALKRGAFDALSTLHLRKLLARLSRVSIKGTACVLTFALAFSMLGTSFQAFADETTENVSAADPADIANIYTPENTSQTSDPTSQDSSSEPVNPPDANEDAPSSEDKDITSRPPQDFYPEQPIEGTPVYMEGEATILQTSERTFTTVIGGVDVAYEDDAGNLHEVDNTLDATKESIFSDDVTYKNRANFFEAALPEKMDEGRGFTITAKGHTIELIPQDGDFQYSMAEDNAIRFTEVAEGVDYQYTLVGSLIKEDIILNRAIDPRDFKTKLVVPDDLSVREDEEGIIGIYSQDGLVLDIAAPIAMDASGAVSDNLKLALSWQDDMPYLVLTPDWDWIESSDRAYPIRIDPTIDIAPSAVRVGCVEQNHPKSFIGENGYAYAGYDDGVKTGTGDFNHGMGHAICRVYTEINYNFTYIMSEARIDSATFSLFQNTAYSGGASNFGLYRVCQPWDFDDMNWRNQESLTHELVQFQYSHPYKDYINWDVRECVNNWIQGIYPQYGFCVKAENERWMQCELFANRNTATPPRLSINWTIPDPVDESISLDSTSINLRTLTEHDSNNKLQFDGVFADGIARPRSTVAYMLEPSDEAGLAYASRSYKYPDSTSWQDSIPSATRYKDKLSNWQSHVFYQLAHDTIYTIKATATLDGTTGRQVASDSFLIYKTSAKDTLPYIASHYGTTLDALAKDNRVQDTLVVDGNTIFVRNPKTADAYNPGDLSEDQKKRIDSALMGRGKHCEYGFEPVNMNTGNFIAEITDATVSDIEGGFTISRTYNSKNDGYASLLGRNWSFEYDEHISANAQGELIYTLGDGKSFWFAPDGEGGYIAPLGSDYELLRIPYEVIDETKEPNDEGVIEPDIYYRYEVHLSDGSYKTFDCYGMLQTITSAKGLETTVQYDDQYRLKSVTSPAGNSYTFTLDELGRISSVALPDGNSVGYSYDAHGDLVEVKEATGSVLSYEYDENSYMTAWYDGSGRRVIENTYDADGRVITQKDGLGNISRIAYADGKTYATDAEGNITVYSYDDQYRTTSITYPDGFVDARTYDGDGNLASDSEGSYTYDAHGNMTSKTDMMGNTSSYAYDSKDRLVSETRPDGESISYTYDERGCLISMVSTSGESHTYTYDEMCRMTSDTDSDGITMLFGWSGANKVTQTDPLGNTTTYGYDAMGRCVSETDALGATTRTYYDALGRVVGQTDRTGAHTSYSLSASGLLESMTDAVGNTSSFAYDEASNIISMTDPQGGTWTYAYDELGNEISETNPLGAVTEKAYDSRGRLVSETDATGVRTSFAYDGLSRKVSETNPQGGATTYKYIGASANPTLVTDPLGNTTIYTYDSLGNTTSTLTSDGVLETTSYAQGGRVSSHTDGAGLTTTIEYSAAGRPVALDMSGHAYRFVYDIAGRVKSATDPEGSTQIIENDADGRVVALTDALGNTTRFAYDGEGRQISITDALGKTTSTEYDGLGNVIKETDALGNTTSYAYNALELVTSVRDAAGNTQSTKYDAAGNLIGETSATGAQYAYSYDAAGRLLSETDSLGRVTSYGYDSAGNMVTLTRADGKLETYRYDLAGNIASVTDAAGLAIDLTYDARGNIVSVASNAAGNESYAYDGASRLIAATDAEGRVSSVLYDLWGNTLRETDFEGTSTNYTYDSLGNATSEADASGNSKRTNYDSAYRAVEIIEKNGAKQTQVFDDAGRLTSIKDALGYTESYEYDAAGNIVSATDKDGYTSYAEYDALGRIISATDGAGSKTTYTYDAAGNVTSVIDALGNTESFGYDTEGQLVSHTDAAGNTETFQYDIMGNMVLHTDVSGAKSAYTYDAHGNLIQEVDALGNATTYEVDLSDNVTKMTDARGATYAYTYDKIGRMTSVTTPKGYTRSFIYSAFDDPIEERDNTGALTKYAFDPMARLSSVTDALGNVSSVAYDALGNAQSATDSTGAVSTYAYDALGRLSAYTDGSGVKSSYSYDGRGNLVKESRGSITRSYAYDALSNVISEVDGRGNKTTYAYDVLGRMISETDTLGNKEAYEYDVLGNLISQTDKTGAKTRYSYDVLGNITETITPKGARSGYEYDMLGRLKKVEDADGTSTTYGYDATGNITDITDALGRMTTYGYDEEGNLTEIASPTGAIEKMEYDLQSRMSALVTPDGATARYSYDALNNMVEKSYSTDANEGVLYTFDGEGRVLSRDDKTGDAAREYDGAGRLISETDGSGQKLTYTYDATGQLASVTYPDGTQVAYAYDGAGNIITITAPEGEYAYTYDSENRPVSLTRPNGTSTAYSYDKVGNTASIENKDASGATLSSYSYTYDADGNIETEKESIAKDGSGIFVATRDFEYTASGKLSKVQEAGDKNYTEIYSYDGAGNRVRLERTGDDADSIAYEYDDDNRLVKTTSAKDGETIYSYDGAGNLVSKVGAGTDTSYTYGVEGRLEAVREGGRLLMAATYDGDGNRTTQSSLYSRDRQLASETDGLDGALDISLDSALDKGSVLRAGVSAFLLGITAQATAFAASVNPATIPWALDVMLWLLIDSAPASEGAPHGIPSLILDSSAITGKERDAIASALGLMPRGLTSTEEVFDVVAYVNSTLTDNVQVMTSVSTRSGTTNETYGISRLATNTNGSATYFLNDGRGSVTQTVSQQGKPTSWRSYSAFGNVEASSNLGDLPSYGYNAEEQHPRTGLTYMRFRYYEAKTSTFGVQDTYLGNIFSPLTLNRYLYCLANPVNYIDPSGHVSVGRLTNIGRIAKNITTKINVLIAKAVTDLFVKIGDKRNAVKFDKKLRKAEEARRRYYKFYCGDAQKITSYIYNRNAAIQYARIFSNDTTHSTDTTLDYYYSLMSFGYRNPLFPTSYPGNCANFTSQALFFGGIPMTKDWHMLPTPAVVAAFLSMQGTPFDSSYRNIYHLWDRTADWTAALNQYEYFSNPDNGYINGDVINITLPNKPALNGAIEVPYSDLNDQLSSLNIQPGDLLYFYNEEGVHHSTMVSSVNNGVIKYTANTTTRFDEPLDSAVENNTEYGFLVVRINDKGEIKK